jgi:hypothetical protein
VAPTTIRAGPSRPGRSPRAARPGKQPAWPLSSPARNASTRASSTSRPLTTWRTALPASSPTVASQAARCRRRRPPASSSSPTPAAATATVAPRDTAPGISWATSRIRSRSAGSSAETRLMVPATTATAAARRGTRERRGGEGTATGGPGRASSATGPCAGGGMRDAGKIMRPARPGRPQVHRPNGAARRRRPGPAQRGGRRSARPPSKARNRTGSTVGSRRQGPTPNWSPPR